MVSPLSWHGGSGENCVVPRVKKSPVKYIDILTTKTRHLPVFKYHDISIHISFLKTFSVLVWTSGLRCGTLTWVENVKFIRQLCVMYYFVCLFEVHKTSPRNSRQRLVSANFVPHIPHFWPSFHSQSLGCSAQFPSIITAATGIIKCRQLCQYPPPPQ